MSIKAVRGDHPHYLLAESLDLAWNKLATAKEVDRTRLRPEVAGSWERCLSQNLDPQDYSRIVQVQDLAEKLEENRLLMKAALRHLGRLHEILPDRGFVVLLAGLDGTLLSLTGQRQARDRAEDVYLRPGVGVSEGSVGTTALGIGLERVRPAQVLLNEHYFRIFHDWCCTSAPIRDPDGRLLGVLNAANRDLARHPAQVMTMVKMAAEAIEAELRHLRLHDERRRASLYFTSALETSPDALIFVDDQDRLGYLNRRAHEVLGLEPPELVGRRAEAVIRDFGRIKGELDETQPWIDLEFLADGQKIGVEASLNLMLDHQAEACGILGSLRRKGDSRRGRSRASSDLRYDFRDFIFGSPVMDRLIRQAKKVAATDHTLLIEGESGTGKEILAQAIHQAGARRDEPFIAVNCAALPRELIQSELFGYEKGSFTGADKGGKPGKFETAHQGTLFLDEIGDMPLEAQANLLRVLQEKKVVRIGGHQSRHLDVRVISATNKDLLAESRAGLFRDDLYYRLAVINLQIPPLRQRPDDIMPLARFFIKKHQGLMDEGDLPRFSRRAQAVLRDYHWPGNVRELENLIIYLLSRGLDKTVEPRDLPNYFQAPPPKPEPGADLGSLEAIERQAIESTLRQCGGNISQAAKLLNISRATVYKKMRKYDLTPPGRGEA